MSSEVVLKRKRHDEPSTSTDEVKSSGVSIPEAFRGREIEQFDISDFTNFEKIAYGGEATVYRAFGSNYGTVAIKTFYQASSEHIMREISMLSRIRHPNIVQLYGLIKGSKDDSISGFVMEYLPLGSLGNVIHNPAETYFSYDIYQWISQISSGLNYLHSSKIIHRDIKPSNLLLGGTKNTLKIADFGPARIVDNLTRTQCVGTLFYMAPEVITTNKYTLSADVYSFSITIWEILHRKYPYYHLEERSHFYLCSRVVDGERPLIEGTLPTELAKLIIRGWSAVPENRPTVMEFLSYVRNDADLSIVVQNNVDPLTGEFLPILLFDDQKQPQLHEENIAKIFRKAEKAEIAFIAGPSKSGKTSLLRSIIKALAYGEMKDKKEDYSPTTGILVWSEPFQIEGSYIYLIDTQGTDDLSMLQKAHIFSLLSVISTTIIFNLMETIQFDDLHNLFMISKMANIVDRASRVTRICICVRDSSPSLISRYKNGNGYLEEIVKAWSNSNDDAKQMAGVLFGERYNFQCFLVPGTPYCHGEKIEGFQNCVEDMSVFLRRKQMGHGLRDNGILQYLRASHDKLKEPSLWRSNLLNQDKMANKMKNQKIFGDVLEKLTDHIMSLSLPGKSSSAVQTYFNELEQKAKEKFFEEATLMSSRSRKRHEFGLKQHLVKLHGYFTNRQNSMRNFDVLASRGSRDQLKSEEMLTSGEHDSESMASVSSFPPIQKLVVSAPFLEVVNIPTQELVNRGLIPTEQSFVVSAPYVPGPVKRQQAHDYAPLHDVPIYKEKNIYILEPIGSGSFGVCLKVMHMVLGTAVLKRSKTECSDATEFVSIRRELSHIFKLNHHKHIVSFYGYVVDAKQKTIGFLMEYMAGGDLTKHVNFPLLTDTYRNTWMRQIASAMVFVHIQGIMHRDLKPNNILLSLNGFTAKVADFGMAKKIETSVNKHTTNIGNLVYTAPEIYMDGNYDYPVDVWSYGLVVYYIYYKQHPFDEAVLKKKSAFTVAQQLRGDNGQTEMRPPYNSLKVDNSIIKKCLKSDPAERITMAKILAYLHSGEGVKLFPVFDV